MLTIILAYQGFNRCLSSGHPCTPMGPLAHETASNNPNLCRFVDAPELLGRNRYANHWNRAALRKQVHGFIGRDINGEIAFAQVLPLYLPCWGVGGGRRGSYNYDRTKSHPDQRAHLQVELCRGSTKDATYYWQAISLMERVFAHWCRTYGWNPLEQVGYTKRLTGHREAARAGFGSNHADPDSLMACFGDSMDKFRLRVAARLEEPAEEVRYVYAHSMPTYYWRPKSHYNGVAVLQDCLTKLGYTVETDGYFGTETHEAVKAFREAHGIPTPVDRKGVQQAVSCDQATWAAINKALNDLP